MVDDGADEVEIPTQPADEVVDLSVEPAFHGVPVVGIGASAGGFDAIKKLIASLAENSGMAFIVIQHLDPKHETHLPSLLSSYTSLKVHLAADGMEVSPNCIYANPAGSYVGVRGNRLYLAAAVTQGGRRMPIDFLFRSLAEARGEKSIGIVLSGTGSDGTQGIRAIRQAGGVVVVQDPGTAQYGDMPESAIGTGLVDAILPVEQMGTFLVERARPAVEVPHVEAPPHIAPEDYKGILAQLLARTRSDFRGYKKSTVLRRIFRRMGLNQIEKPHDYLEFLRRNPDEAAQLRNDLLIGVTGFFREPEAFDDLCREAISQLVETKSPEEPIRVWVPGCASGEEAYSVSMLFLEEMERQGRTGPLQIFASDIDRAALDVARNGVYGRDVEQQLTLDRLRRFLSPVASGYTVSKQIREPIVFSVQNLVSDPPFSKLDLICCRNVLIYLQPEVQRKVMSLFAFSLRPGGYLFLGKSDSISGRDDLFELLSKKGRLFRRRASAKPDVGDLPSVRIDDHAIRMALEPGKALARPTVLSMVNQQVLLDHFGASLVLTDAKAKILHFFGDAAKFLTLPTGEPDLDLLKMARDRLGLRLRPAIHKALQTEERVFIEKVPVDWNGGTMLVNSTIRVLHPEGWTEPIVATIFEEAAETAPELERPRLDEDTVVRELEAELRATKDELQSTYEEFETSNEELKAANEEMMSMNEELQSANEELETSKEELQSINEELTTVNNQLSEKLDELSAANNDLANLLNVTQVATIFLDAKLKIKRFTPEATKLFNLIHEDIGRPIEHISQKFSGVGIIPDAKKALETLTAVDREVQCEEGTWYKMRVFPYRTLDNRIDGVVLTFNDVMRIKLAEGFAQALLQMARHPLAILDADLRVAAANEAFTRFLGLKPGEAVGELLYRLSAGQLDRPHLRLLLDDLAPGEAGRRETRLVIESPQLGRREVVLEARRVERESGALFQILLALQDMTGPDPAGVPRAV